MHLSPDHFRYLDDPQQAAHLFKQSVATVEIEIHSYCNRVCNFCPNSFIDRRSNKQIMDPALYSKIIDDLATIDFSGIIWYSRYNEPTADRDLFLERLREARAKLPHVRLQTYTNGDYLNPEYIAAMRDAGMNELRIMTYLAPKEEPTPEKLLETTLDRLKKLGLPYKFVEEGLFKVEMPGIELSYNYHDLAKIGTNRGGALETGTVINRTSPCAMSLLGVYVDYTGAMVPCCDIRSDYEGHKNCITYTLTPDKSLFDGYANSKLVLWRRSMLRYGEKASPCNSCSRWLLPENETSLEVYKNIGRMADEIGEISDQERKQKAATGK